MKKLLSCALIFAGSCLYLLASKPNTMVHFSSTNWEQAKQQAQTEKKLYFVDFDANYCATCRNMEQSTYMDQELAQYMNSNVIANKVNIQDFDGVMWSQQYEVEALPTMLIFNENGKLMKRLVGYQSAQALLTTFKDIRNNKVVQKRVAMAPDQPIQRRTTTNGQSSFSINAESTAEETPTFRPIVSTKPAQTTKQMTSTPKDEEELIFTPVLSSNSTDELPASSTHYTAAEEEVKESEVYEISVKKQVYKKYSVQVGVYSSYTSLLDQAEALQQNFKQKLYMRIDQKKNKQLFRLFLGQFSDHKQASTFRKQLRQKGIDGMVKNLSRLN